MDFATVLIVVILLAFSPKEENARDINVCIMSRCDQEIEKQPVGDQP